MTEEKPESAVPDASQTGLPSSDSAVPIVPEEPRKPAEHAVSSAVPATAPPGCTAQSADPPQSRGPAEEPAGAQSGSAPPKQVLPLLRKVMQGSLKTASDYEACLLNYFPNVYSKLAVNMDRQQQSNLLLVHNDPHEVLQGLAKNNPAEFHSAVAALKSDEQSALISIYAEQTQDPTTPLVLTAPSESSPYDEAQLSEWAELLTTDHLLLLSSGDHAALREGQSLLARQPAFRELALRRLDLDRSIDFPLALDWLVAVVQSPPSGHANGVFLVIEALDSQRAITTTFLSCCHQTLARDSALSNLKAQLAARRCYILILSHEAGRAYEALRPALRCVRRVSGLESVVRRRGTDPAEAAELLRRITAQSAQLGMDERSLCQWLERHPSLAEAAAALELAARTGGPPQPAQPELDVAGALVQTDDQLKQTVLYVAAFLPGLSADDFQQAVLALLDDRKVEVGLPKAGDGTAGAMKSRLLRELWPERRQQLLRECRLRPAPADVSTGERPLQFTEPGLEASMRRAIEDYDPWRHDEVLELLRITGLMFRGSRRLGQRVIDLVVARLALEPSRVGVDWLLAVLRHAGPAVPEIEAEDTRQAVLMEILRENRQLVLERLTGLLAALQAQPVESLSKLSRRLLDRLVELKLEDPAIELWRRLYRRNRQLDVTWLWHMLCSGSEEAKQRAERTLYQLLRGQERAEAAGEALTALLTWINRPPARLPSEMGKRLALILHTWLLDLITHPQRLRNRTEFEASALGWLASAGAQQETVLTALASTLVHPWYLAVSAPRWPFFVMTLVSLWLISDEVRGLISSHEDGEAIDRSLAVDWLRAAFLPTVPTGKVPTGESLLPHLFQTLWVTVLYSTLCGQSDRHSESPLGTEFANNLVIAVARATEQSAPQAISKMVSYVALMRQSVQKLLAAVNSVLVTPTQRSVFSSERARLLSLGRHLQAVQQILRSVKPRTTEQTDA